MRHFRLAVLFALAACANEDPGIAVGPDASVATSDGGTTPDAYAPPVCGDGKVTGDEQCDDGDSTSGDGCSACTVEPDWVCTGGVNSQCKPMCGDGKIIASETCDDGDGQGGDGCSAACKVETDCECSGTPSVCSCTRVQVITVPPQYVDTAAIEIDGSGNPRIAYVYGVNFTDPVTNYLREHTYLMYGERGSSGWSTSQVQTWDQTQTSLDAEDIELATDGGTLRAYFQRIYHANGAFAVGTRFGANWAFTYDNPYYVRDVVRGAGAWHVLADAPSYANLRYRAGEPGAWTKDEPVTGFSISDPLRLAHATDGNVYIANIVRASGNASFTTKLAKRTGANAWVTLLQGTTNAPPITGGCVYPISVTPLALPGGAMLVVEEAFDKTGKRWLRSHRYAAGQWVVEEIADLSWLSSSCTTGGASYTLHKIVTGVDGQGRPHVVFPARPPVGSTTSAAIEDHYRDATGWHVRTFAITNAHPFDVTFDAAGTMHVVANVPVTGSNTRLAHLSIAEDAWQ